MISKEIIFKTFSEMGLSSNDVVMIHGDAGPAAQIKCNAGESQLAEFIRILVCFFSNGTVLVPSFTYSSIKNESFDPLLTESKVGLFSEYFRHYSGVTRSSHPIFSFSVYGKNKDKYIDTSLNDCFGVGTTFDEFYKANGKILCIGCSLDRSTFIHYVEQKINVSYRYFKNFQSSVITNGSKHELVTRYFVRDLNLDTSTELSLLKTNALSSNKLIESNLGRFPVTSISAHDFFYIANELYKTNPYSLINQRICNG